MELGQGSAGRELRWPSQHSYAATMIYKAKSHYKGKALIILLMSLLTSPQTTRDQLRFFSKMERQFNKKSFINQNYIEDANPFEQAHENMEKAQEGLRELMTTFLKDLKAIYQSAVDTRIDFYFILSEMKSYDFFQQVANIIHQTLIEKNSKIQRENRKLKEDLRKTRQQLRKISRTKIPLQKKDQNPHFNAIKTVAENLYQKSKVLTEQEFIQLCDRVILQEKIVIKKVAEGQTYRKWEDSKSQKVSQKAILAKIDTLLQKKYKETSSNIQADVTDLIATLKRQIEKKDEVVSCDRPCCNLIQDKIERKTKASALRRFSESRKEGSVYKNDRSEEYFNRYYRKSQFDMHKVLNVERTKLEQMERIEDDYRIAVKQRYKLNRSMVK